jgi:glutamyl-Q tRNA(Asp) synthetase
MPGRFAPSPTGVLHAGSLVAALASWLDARARGEAWRVRIEDVDTPRCMPGAEAQILSQLAACGLHPDGPIWRQSDRGVAYASALDGLLQRGVAFLCGCTRNDIEAAWAARGVMRPRHGELVYPGTCRGGLAGRPERAIRVRSDAIDGAHVGDVGDVDGSDIVIDWTDRRLGPQRQNLTRAVGDFVLRRADGLWAYQLAVVVDDAAQGVTHVVRGEDLSDNTARQIHLQRLLGLPTPTYLHVPLVLGADGQKLSKQNGATALDLRDPLAALQHAAEVLGLGLHRTDGDSLNGRLSRAVEAWAQKWVRETRMADRPGPAR